MTRADRAPAAADRIPRQLTVPPARRRSNRWLFFGCYEQTLHTLGLVDRDDPITEMVAKKIGEIGQASVRDAAELSKRAIKELGVT